MKKPKNETMYLGQDIQDKVTYLSQFPNKVLAAALLFTIANTMPVTEEDLNDANFTNIVDLAGDEALSLANNINQLYNSKNETRH